MVPLSFAKRYPVSLKDAIFLRSLCESFILQTQWDVESIVLDRGDAALFNAGN